MDRLGLPQLFAQPPDDIRQILRFDNRRQLIAQFGKFSAGIADEIKQTVVGADKAQLLIIAAAENRAGNVIV